MTDTKTLTKADLIQFTGSEHWYRHAMVRDILYTDGVKHVAETAGAYWLIDEIAFAQRFDKLLAAEEFQLETQRECRPHRDTHLRRRQRRRRVHQGHRIQRFPACGDHPVINRGCKMYH